MGNTFCYLTSCLYKDDPELQYEVVSALLRQLPKKAFPGIDWIKEAIGDCPNQDWDDEETRVGNIKDIVEQARARYEAARKGKRSNKEKREPKMYASTSVALSYATVYSLSEPIRAIRLKYWSTAEPPFERSSTGLREAFQWFANREEVDDKSCEARPGAAEFSFSLRTRDCVKANRVVSEARASYTAKVPLGVAKDMIAAAEDDALVTFSTVTFGPFRPKTINLGGFKGGKPFFAIQGQVLDDLRDDIMALVKQSGWWQEHDALEATLFGGIPSAAPKAGSKTTISVEDGSLRREITIKVIAPATNDEVAKAYADELDYLQLRPSPITNQQSALLQLFVKYPEVTWTERLTIWQRWCRSHPSLKNYANWRALRSSHLNAKEKATRG